MKTLVKYSLSLALGLTPALLFAQEPQWRPAGNPTAASFPSGAPSLGLSKPVPLDGPTASLTNPAVPVFQPIVRAQNPEDSRPLPPGPLLTPGGPVDVKSSPVSQDPDKQAPKKGEFIAPPPQSAKPPMPIFSTVGSPGNAADCGNPCGESCGNPCATSCWGAGLCGGAKLFGKGGRCADPCNLDCDPCCIRPRAWVYADYLLWMPQNQSMPTLVTAGPAGTGAVLGQPATTVLFDGFDTAARSGIRVGGGFWFREDGLWGLDGSFWTLGNQTRTFTAGGAGGMDVARPINSVGPFNPGPDAQLVVGTGVTGTVTVQERQEIWGMDANLRRKLCCGPRGWLDFQLGYRYFWLSESLDITENLTGIPPGIVPGLQVGENILLRDHFGTSNTFNGGQIGLAGQWNFLPRWYLGGNVRFAMGFVHQTVDIDGTTQFSGLAGIVTAPQPGGLLALPTNIGSQTDYRFAVMPEAGLKLGFNITPNLSIYAGYDVLYISSVVRPGNQIDLNVNKTQQPTDQGPSALRGIARPAPLFVSEGFWIHGFNFGMRYQW